MLNLNVSGMTCGHCVSAVTKAVKAVPGAEVTTAVECRYEGQSHEVRVATVADFAAEHRRRNGYDRPTTPVEVVALRATPAIRASPLVLAARATLWTGGRCRRSGSGVVVCRLRLWRGALQIEVTLG